MMLKKPKFWDYKKPNYISYLLRPFTLPIIINNFFFNLVKNDKKYQNIKTICLGNIYVGGTGKTPLSIKISKILENLNFKTATIKKFYKNQIDEQKLLAYKTKLYCNKKRVKALNEAIKDNVDVAIFDDGLQDGSINYDLRFVCFNTLSWIGNGSLIPAGPLRENLKNISNYDAIFLNGNQEDVSEIKLSIKKYSSNIKIFETYYESNNINKYNTSDRYIIFSGIGNPESFRKMLDKKKFNIIQEIKFPDHHQYSSKDINKIKLLAKNLNAKILTTEKDLVKINNNDNNEIGSVTIDLIIKQEDELIKYIKSNI